MAAAYDLLGEILATQERTDELAAYVRQTLEFAAEGRAYLSGEDMIRGVYMQGGYGMQVHSTGSTHAEVLEVVGVVNAEEMRVISDTYRAEQ